ncbi:DUF6086 family protein [Streptomyces sp. NPDC002536]
MSQYFDVGDETLWNPSNGAARPFLRQVALFEEELGLSSGIGPMLDDECQIDPAPLEAFVNALLARHRRTRHAITAALSEGFVSTMLVLAERAGVDVRWAPPNAAPDEALRDVQAPQSPTAPGAEDESWTAALRAKVRELDRFMPM